jgi:hypothetical protein
MNSDLRRSNELRVIITDSPYLSVKNGTKATVETVIRDHFGINQNMYVTRGLSHNNYRGRELTLEDANE